jgi:hypothetical protein
MNEQIFSDPHGDYLLVGLWDFMDSQRLHNADFSEEMVSASVVDTPIIRAVA